MSRKVIISLTILFIGGFVSGQSVYDIMLKAKALNSGGNYNQAISVLSGFPGLSDDSRLLVLRGETKLLAGETQAAIMDFNSANGITENSGEYGLAKAYALAGDPATSLYHLETSMKSSFRKSEKEIMLDPAFEKIESRPEWRLFWKKDWYSVVEMKISEIEFYIKAGDLEEAKNQLAELEKDYRGHALATFGSSLIEIASGKYGDATGKLTGLLSSEPANEKYLRALASAQLGASNYSGASVTYSKLISMEVPDADLYLMRAECYRKTGERMKAMNDINKYLSWYPGSKEALSLAGKTESTLGNNLKALEYLSENVRIHPNDPECYIDRGDSYFLSRSWKWAINDYSMSLDLQPRNPDVWLSKGIALLNSGNRDDACHDFREAFSLGNKKAVEYISKYCIK